MDSSAERKKYTGTSTSQYSVRKGQFRCQHIAKMPRNSLTKTKHGWRRKWGAKMHKIPKASPHARLNHPDSRNIWKRRLLISKSLKKTFQVSGIFLPELETIIRCLPNGSAPGCNVLYYEMFKRPQRITCFVAHVTFRNTCSATGVMGSWYHRYTRKGIERNPRITGRYAFFLHPGKL